MENDEPMNRKTQRMKPPAKSKTRQWSCVCLAGGCFLLGLWALLRLFGMIPGSGFWIFHIAIWCAAGMAIGAGIMAHVFEVKLHNLSERFAEAKRQNDTAWIQSVQAGEFGELTYMLQNMADDMYKIIRELEKNRARLFAILQNMDNGVVAADKEGRISLINNRAKEFLGLDTLEKGSMLEGNSALLRLRRLIENVQDDHEPQRGDISVFGEMDRLLSVYAAALPDAAGGGSLTVLNDITRLTKLENMRTTFVANVTHELKTPLTSICGYIELLQQGLDQEEMRQRAYEVIAIEAERLQKLIADILTLSEIEALRGTDANENVDTFDVIPILHKIMESVDILLRKKHVHIRIEAPEQLNVSGSPFRMRQLMENLIVNAIQYNVEGGDIWIKIRRDPQWFFFQIHDTGIGVAQEHHERLFERFYRVDKARSREQGGTGLGLSIVKHIVALYGGEVCMASQEGGGTTFFVKIRA